jgi:UV DNA damage endonuclease
MSIGYACLAIGVPGTGISGCILKNAGDNRLRSIITMNLKALDTMVDYNRKHGIKLFRISSDIIPFGSHPVNQISWWKDYEDELKEIGNKIREANMRVSMHPGQYTVLNSPVEKVARKAVEDLIYHNRLLTSLGMDRTHKLILHIGGSYGDKREAIKNFLRNYQKLPQELKDRLAIENDDKSFHIMDLLMISEQIGAPVVFDNLHHRVRPPDKRLPMEHWIRECGKTWRKEDGRQKLHFSLQKKGGSLGAHSDTIWLEEFLEFYHGLPEEKPDIMLEVKDKNLSAVKCILGTTDAQAEELKQEWGRYQYFILSRSADLFLKIRDLLMLRTEGCVRDFYGLIEQAYLLPEDRESQLNAAVKLWNKLSSESSKAERNRFDKLLRAYENGTGELGTVKKHLFKLAEKQGQDELLQSLYFYL